MICFSAITPHPPLLIPGIGEPDDLKRVQNTVNAMEALSQKFQDANPEAVIIISPHASLDPYSFAINADKFLKGDLMDFGLDKEFIFENDLELADKIIAAGKKEKIPLTTYEAALDHGALVPLYYLAKNQKIQIVHLSFSFFSLAEHYKYGKVIGKVCGKSKKRIALIASGDLSHRLTMDAPAGYSPLGKKFDEKLIELLEKKETSALINLDKILIEEAGECGLRSIIILLGALAEKKYEFNKLSYEGPFGVGYLVAELKLSLDL